MPLSFGLFHQQESIRDLTVELLNTLRGYPVRFYLLILHSISLMRLLDWSSISSKFESLSQVRVRASGSRA